MDAKELRACLKDIDWFFRHVDSWAVEPSQYTEALQTRLLREAQAAHISLKAVMEELERARKESEG